MALYSLRKSHQILKTGNNWYQKKSHILTASQLQQFEKDLQSLDQSIVRGDRTSADNYARKVEAFNKSHFRKSFFQYTYELLFAILVALAVATIVRQVWFELYEIPTGSMRPTFKEKDHLTVSKLSFGINTPLRTDHLYFDPNLVQRTSVLIFSGDKIPIIDSYTNFLGIFPYKKRFIKREIAKPGDTVYFYGGKIYALDKEGNLINELLDSPWMEKLEHIPFISFEGMTSIQNANRIQFQQMHIPIGRISLSTLGTSEGEIFNGTKWIKDHPNAQKESHNEILTYSDIWGIKNFAMARLLTKDELPSDFKINDEALLYLELRHTPSMSYPKPRLEKNFRGYGVFLSPHTTYIPLKKEHLENIMDNMYTARFVVENGKARRYNVEENSKNTSVPSFPDVSEGTYEFYHGKAVQIGFGGIPYDLPNDHPLYNRSVENIRKLFNLGIEFDNMYSPKNSQQIYFPSRYAYFRNGDLFLLGAPILKKDDPTLVTFNKNEQQRQDKSSQQNPYIAFKDYGPPLKEDGSIDKEFIKTFGLKIPEKSYLVLGDNHAMSADSRIFGFVPEKNLQGAPSLIIWPPSDRLGRPLQKPYPIFNVPRSIIWFIALFIAVCWYLFQRRNMRQPTFKPLLHRSDKGT